jgi:C1A family cysteine protease
MIEENRLYNKKAYLAKEDKYVGTGWLARKPDLQDYHKNTTEVTEIMKKTGIPTGKKGFGAPSLPAQVDLRSYFSPIEDQGQLGSCTANGTVGIVEYFERRAFNKHIDGSRLFVYKVTRNLMGVTGDTGAWLRNALGAIVMCGVAPERYWPYTDVTPDFDIEPPAFAYALGENYKAVKYFCHDPLGANVPTPEVVQSMKNNLATGIPSVFGFWGFGSFDATDVKGGIPIPCDDETEAKWGHAIVAVGYDDKKKITNTSCDKTTEGAFIIRNSWGTGWGEDGYGYIPYEYFLRKLALDAWSLISAKWIDTDQFKFQE